MNARVAVTTRAVNHVGSAVPSAAPWVVRALPLSGRVLRSALVSLILGALLLSPAATAASRGKKAKKKPAASGPLVVVVLPFPGPASGRAVFKDALELELELEESVEVVASESVEADLQALRSNDRTLGDGLWAPAVLAGVLKRRDVDILLRPDREVLHDGALSVVGYGKDGQPRFYKEVVLDAEPNVAAASVVSGLRPLLPGFAKRKPIRLPNAPDAERGDDTEGDGRAGARVIAQGNSETSGGEGDRGPRARIDDAEATPGDSGESGSDRSTLDADGAKRRPSIDDPEAPPPTGRLTHVASVAIGFSLGMWSYALDGQPVGTSTVGAASPGGTLSADLWFIPAVGVDVDVLAAYEQFRNGGAAGQALRPATFGALQLGVGAALKARLVLESGLPGLALGVRVGYRAWGSTVEPQTVPDGRLLTVVPGFVFHSLLVGPEVVVPIAIGASKLEISLRGEGLPLSFYAEQPDNPGRTSVAIGWHAALGLRYRVVGGLFVEARGDTIGASATFAGTGTRSFLDAGGALVPYAGGKVTNFRAAFNAGVGWAFE